MSTLSIEALTKAYGSDTVLKGLDLSISAGQSVAVIGPSGCGKSSLLNIIGSLDTADSGQVIFNDVDILKFSEKEKLNYRANDIGFIFQEPHLLPQLTCLENITLPASAAAFNGDKEQHLKHAKDLITNCGLTERIDAFPATMSGGERQRCAIARALAHKPKLILADEPTGALDNDNANTVIDLMLKLCKEQDCALLLVTHNLSLAEKMDLCLNLANGELQPAK